MTVLYIIISFHELLQILARSLPGARYTKPAPEQKYFYSGAKQRQTQIMSYQSLDTGKRMADFIPRYMLEARLVKGPTLSTQHSALSISHVATIS